MANDHGNDERGKKRKKKRSQIQMAKKLARQRNHGSDVDSETYQYMVHILELMKGDFSTTEEKLIFVNNVYEQTLGREVEYARNQVGSRILDSLLKYARLETIERLVAAFKSTLRPLSSDTFASHVLQKIIVVCADRGNKNTISGSCIERDADIDIEVKDSEIESYNSIVLNLSKYFINNIEEFVFDTYANHVLRTVIECLGGLIDKSDNSTDKRKVIFGERRSVIQEYKDLLFGTCNRLYRWPRFLEFGQDELTSGLLQSVLYSLKGTFPELMETYIKKITEECFEPGKGEQELSNIFHAESNLKRLSSMRSANFSVQRLFDHCTVKEHFEQLFEEIHTHFGELLDKGHTGVLVSVANACLRLQTKQGAFVTDLLKVLGCEANERQHRIVTCIISLRTFEHWEHSEGKEENDLKRSISLQGSLIVQDILRFNKPIKMVNSLLETDVEELARIFEDPKGSRIVDAFMDSKYIGEKSREKLAKKLKGYWAQLARSTHGSRSLDRIWEWARITQRTLIMEELAAVGESLRSTKSGQIISNKLNVPLFTRNKKDWMEALGKEEKTRALFVNIIGNAATKGK
ncbi:nucleolar protein 9 isoform X2 [Bombus terrestris]|uniref:Nucleolar protein 9 isoform X2 n=1 Tax=Bombus terrestris TaxID=30195 RepID=A0A9C6S8U4_BOMTE|nr:nucleolar protein 9 isoform X2 [Bombus terrestris]